MARFMVLIYGDEQRWSTMPDSEMAEIDAGHRAFQAKAGPAVLAAGQLEPPTMATTVRRGARPGALAVTDGPFLETKEVVGGFYLLEAGDLDEVLELVALLHEVRADHSGVEVTPLVGRG
jgi:hypothetical protein